MKRFASTAAVVVTILLLAQAGLVYSSVRNEYVPDSRPLAGLPNRFGEWRIEREGVVEKEILDVLQADDLVNRTYVRPGEPHPASLFVAFFRSQRTGKVPHSPKNCLPGNGWLPIISDRITIDGGLGPMTVNRYLISRGESRALVLYWYQSRDRVVASEYTAKFYVVADAMRYNRTDTALIKITMPLAGREDDAMPVAEDFVRSFYPTVREFLPR